MNDSTRIALEKTARVVLARLNTGFRSLCAKNAFSDLHIETITVDAANKCLDVVFSTRDVECQNDVNFSMQVAGNVRQNAVQRIVDNATLKVVMSNRTLSATATDLEFKVIGSLVAQHVLSAHAFYYAVSRISDEHDGSIHRHVLVGRELRGTNAIRIFNGTRGTIVQNEESLVITPSDKFNTTKRLSLSRSNLTQPLKDLRKNIRSATLV
jgi:hypothetical protein